MALSLSQARSVYDRIGRIQDWQAFYEDETLDRLVANAALAPGQTIFEFGCGTGKLAANLLAELPASVNYVGVDISPVMINLATSRLAPWADRAKVTLVDGSLPLPAGDRSADRVLSTFVFDLLDEAYARAVLDDLRRILTADGLLCVASLSYGERPLERVACRAWNGLWRVAPQLVGGCRPISVSALLDPGWKLAHHSHVHRFGLVMEVVIASPNASQP
ncbi:class I SAM-dependent methyltransferase [Mycobacterium marinum]|uniref:class I SAM-dependent methyltransferase n=1 Tax=Mycobacterium marinum TaxID=1781 RepID=UPI0023592193|nr:class I SAM-dependent methyltransferase [Mycobacterium marinum]MDC8982347.1 class I SAM-dependent methyltransferase [Mycobacterium marinum]MDC9000374.1 class I SAM-dependent methyltransferase [Mycobacterium marinum]MDC9011638.1 class I SAM-dependent methyltransferase [Mycobacterium marinum]ULL11315.1 SAM-dependent methyltransferase [Mycobacterium liflandii]